MGIEAATALSVVDEELLCSICTDIIEQPRCCRAGHVFCEACITTWLGKNSSCPIGREDLQLEELAHVRPLERMIERMRVRCPNRATGRSWPLGASGCGWVGLCADRGVHLDDCTWQHVPCTVPGCDTQVPRRRLAAHLSSCKGAPPRRETALPGNGGGAQCQKPASAAVASSSPKADDMHTSAAPSRRLLAGWPLVATGVLLLVAALLAATWQPPQPPVAEPTGVPADAGHADLVDAVHVKDAAAPPPAPPPVPPPPPPPTKSRPLKPFLTVKKADVGNEPGGTDGNAPADAGGGIDISFDTDTATPHTIVTAMRGLGSNADVQESGCLALWSLAYRNGATSAEIVRAGGVEAVIAAMQTHVRLSPSNWRVQELCTAALWNMAIDGWWREGEILGEIPPAGPASTSAEIVTAGGLEAVVGAMMLHATEQSVVESGIGLLGFFAQDSDHWQALARTGGIDAVLQVSHFLIYRSPACFTDPLTILTASGCCGLRTLRADLGGGLRGSLAVGDRRCKSGADCGSIG